MRLTATALALILTAGSAMAQTPIAVQSGEHDSFTRLVLTVDPSRDWSLILGENQAEFVLLGGGVAFNIADVFTRIPRDRLADISTVLTESEGRLVMRLNCDCAVNAFAYQGRYVVLDIAAMSVAAQPPQPIAPTAAATEAPRDTDPAHRAPQLFRHDRSTTAPMVADLSIGNLDAPYSARANTTGTGAPVAAIIDQTATDRPPSAASIQPDLQGSPSITALAQTGQDQAAQASDAEIAARIAEAQTALLEQLTRAAEQGLIDFVEVAPDPRPEPDPVPEPEPQSEIVDGDVPDPASDPALMRQIIATTVYDRDGSAPLADIVNTFARIYCVEDDELDVANWGGTGRFGDELAVLHSAMVEERDRPLPDAAIDLVRFHIRYGLGREAYTTLVSYELLDGAPLLAELALVADDAPIPVDGILDRGQGCGGAHEMWRLIGVPDRVEDPIIEVESVLQAFAALPIDLRMHLAPRLGAAFMARGQADIAARALALAARAGVQPSAALRLLGARLTLANDPAAAEIEFAALVAENADIAPAAMMLWAQSLELRGASAPETLIQSLGAAAFELRGSAQGRALRLAEITARAGAEGFSHALDLVVSDLGRDPLADTDLRTVAATLMGNAMPDPEHPARYPDTILRHRNMLPADGAARLTIAAHLLDLGLPDLAIDVLGDVLKTSTDGQVLAARAELARFNPAATLRLLQGREDGPALELVAAAFAQQGLHSAALDALTRAGVQNEPRADAAFLAGAWDQVDHATPNSAAELARYMALRGVEELTNGDLPQSPAEAFLHPMATAQPNTLDAARATLDANRASRAYLESLLNTASAN